LLRNARERDYFAASPLALRARQSPAAPGLVSSLRSVRTLDGAFNPILP